MLAMKAPYHLSHVSSPFCFSYFGDGVLLYALGGLDHDSPIYASHVVRMTGTC
jgi:hypothetical protein